MKFLHHFLFPTLLFAAINLPAQEFKIIKDTTDYILKEVNMDFYNRYLKEDIINFNRDTPAIKKVKGVLLLPLDNGKQITLVDSPGAYNEAYKYFDYNAYYKKANVYFIMMHSNHGAGMYYVNKYDGKIDTLDNIPYYSPSISYYGYCDPARGNRTSGYVKFKNLKTGKATKIDMREELTSDFRWVNDQAFVFYTDLNSKKRYYLVEIKH